MGFGKVAKMVGRGAKAAAKATPVGGIIKETAGEVGEDLHEGLERIAEAVTEVLCAKIDEGVEKVVAEIRAQNENNGRPDAWDVREKQKHLTDAS